MVDEEILMPALSPTMEEGGLAKWLIKPGDFVKAGDIIAEIETDKAIMEFEATSDCKIKSLLVEEGATQIKVNTPIIALEIENSQKLSASMKTAKITSEPKRVETKGPTKKTEIKKPSSKKEEVMTVRESIRDAITEEMRIDESVFLIGEEVGEYQGAYKVSQGLLEEFGMGRVIDTPITEHGFTGLAAGAAFAGLRPIVEFMTFNFSMQAMDQIINTCAKTLYMSGGQMNCPIVLRGPNGAASQVAAQHSQDFAPWFSSVPGLKVVQPFSASDAKGLLKTAIRDPNPVIFLENEMLYNDPLASSNVDEELVPFGKARILRQGSDVTLISYGIGVKHALQATILAEEKGISIELIDLRSLRPLDYASIFSSVKKTNRCITIEECFPVCSIGNHLSASIMENIFDYLDAPVINCTGKDVPMPYAKNLETAALITVDEILTAIKKVLNHS
ncbi:MAG: pyruvate dehydrogenase complex E1 component subunit beta [Rhodobacteraceae bacterium]|nr:MAG: pyruvate dehydrogenase complex E1 component subunit beta [Paracoccaceae bacterium]